MSIIFKELSENATKTKFPDEPQAIAVGHDLLDISSTGYVI